MKKRIWRALGVLVRAFAAFVIIVAFTPLANWLARPLVVEPKPGSRPAGADVIAVLGGGAFENGVLAPASTERLVGGLVLYKGGLGKRLFLTGAASVAFLPKMYHTLSGGAGAAAPGGPLSEGALMRDQAVRLGVPPEAVAVDGAAMNTRENLQNLKAYMAANGLDSCVIVTSSTHMLRASLVAEKLGLGCSLAPLKETASLTSGAAARIALFREVVWEFAALALYRVYGYI